eukprot:TRINITY_DN24471_c0_g6_i1.p1 TRINITY_DN24471_c0_g6~~TRINITY_DN24471_c0_g6_i1.p1  ORF type:complete len:1006 (-),score=240.17 TRINITY_DN24471_c0_g6_i1:384-3401(-)
MSLMERSLGLESLSLPAEDLRHELDIFVRSTELQQAVRQAVGAQNSELLDGIRQLLRKELRTALDVTMESPKHHALLPSMREELTMSERQNFDMRRSRRGGSDIDLSEEGHTGEEPDTLADAKKKMQQRKTSVMSLGMFDKAKKNYVNGTSTSGMVMGHMNTAESRPQRRLSFSAQLTNGLKEGLKVRKDVSGIMKKITNGLDEVVNGQRVPLATKAATPPADKSGRLSVLPSGSPPKIEVTKQLHGAHGLCLSEDGTPSQQNLAKRPSTRPAYGSSPRQERVFKSESEEESMCSEDAGGGGGGVSSRPSVRLPGATGSLPKASSILTVDSGGGLAVLAQSTPPSYNLQSTPPSSNGGFSGSIGMLELPPEGEMGRSVSNGSNRYESPLTKNSSPTVSRRSSRQSSIHQPKAAGDLMLPATTVTRAGSERSSEQEDKTSLSPRAQPPPLEEKSRIPRVSIQPEEAPPANSSISLKTTTTAAPLTVQQMSTGATGRSSAVSFCEGTSRTSTGKVNFDEDLFEDEGSNEDTESSVEEEGEDEKNRLFAPRAAVARIVNSAMFDYLIGLVIVVNGLTIGLETDYMMVNNAEESPPVYRTLEIVVGSIFCSEIVLRLLADAQGFFFGQACRWNIFDLALVVIQIWSEILVYFAESSGEKQGMNMGFIRMLRLFRLIRIMRVARLLRFITELQMLTLSIIGCMKSLLYTTLLLFLMIYIVSVFLTQLAVDRKPELPAEAVDELRIYYGSLPRTILTIYQAIMGGLDWAEAMEPVLQHIGVFAGFLFAIFMAFVLLAMMNIVTGVFVESSLKNAKETRENNLMSLAQNLFRGQDGALSSDLLVSWEDFEAQLENPTMKDFFKIIEIDIAEAENVFQLLDVEGVGTIALDQFLTGVLGLRGPSKAIDLCLLAQENRQTKRKHFAHIGIMEHQLKQITESLGKLQDSIHDAVGAAGDGSPTKVGEGGHHRHSKHCLTTPLVGRSSTTSGRRDVGNDSSSVRRSCSFKGAGLMY